MKEDVAHIKSSNDILIFADKTNNLYKTSEEEYKKLLFNNITKSYRKSTKRLEKAINMEAKHISKKLELSNRVECLAENTAFISLKDHKPNSDNYIIRDVFNNFFNSSVRKGWNKNLFFTENY